MGNCFAKSKKSKAEIAPNDFIKSTAAIRLCGSPARSSTAYIRFALLYKTLSLDFVPTDSPDTQMILQIGLETVSGTRETLLRFIDEKFQHPPLLVMGRREGVLCERTPLIVWAVVLQHRSMTWHMERIVRWGEDLATRGGKKAVDLSMGSLRLGFITYSKQ